MSKYLTLNEIVACVSRNAVKRMPKPDYLPWIYDTDELTSLVTIFTDISYWAIAITIRNFPEF